MQDGTDKMKISHNELNLITLNLLDENFKEDTHNNQRTPYLLEIHKLIPAIDLNTLRKDREIIIDKDLSLTFNNLILSEEIVAELRKSYNSVALLNLNNEIKEEIKNKILNIAKDFISPRKDILVIDIPELPLDNKYPEYHSLAIAAKSVPSLVYSLYGETMENKHENVNAYPEVKVVILDTKNNENQFGIDGIGVTISTSGGLQLINEETGSINSVIEQPEYKPYLINCSFEQFKSDLEIVNKHLHARSVEGDEIKFEKLVESTSNKTDINIISLAKTRIDIDNQETLISKIKESENYQELSKKLNDLISSKNKLIESFSKMDPQVIGGVASIISHTKARANQKNLLNIVKQETGLDLANDPVAQESITEKTSKSEIIINPQVFNYLNRTI